MLGVDNDRLELLLPTELPSRGPGATEPLIPLPPCLSTGMAWTLCALCGPQGEKRPRLEGDEYYAVIEEFCTAVKHAWPNCLLQASA